MRKFEELAGGLMMIGIEGNKVTPSIRKLVKTVRPGGVIFFRPNFSSAASFRRLVSGLEKNAGKKLLTAVDHEGGRVIHLANTTVFPDNLVLGNTGKESYARRQGNVEARELRNLGILMNLAPTVDVLGDNYSPNIGIRSYGKNPDLVSKLGTARIKAMQNNGAAACAKHFPGQGHSSLDAHLDLPVLSSPSDEIEKIHLKPFRAAIAAGVEAVMSSHPIYPQMDGSSNPATFSREIIYDLLRVKMKFEGLILTDDLEMGALKNLCSIGESACRAVEAGHDMVLVCHDPKNVIKVYESLVAGFESGRLNAWELEKSLVRIENLKKKYSAKSGAVVKAGMLPDKICAEGVKRLKSHAGFRFKRGDDVTLIFPRLVDLASRIYIEREMFDVEKFLKQLCLKNGLKCRKVITSGIIASVRDIDEAENIDGHVIYFCYDAHMDPNAVRILNRLPRAVRKAAVVFMRNPYDSKFADRRISAVQSFGFRVCQIKAALKLLVSK